MDCTAGVRPSCDEISAEAGVAPELASAVLAAFTAPKSPANASFTSLGDFNIANALPILRSPSGDYVSLQTYGVVEALCDSPFYWMAADKSYKDIAFSHRGTCTRKPSWRGGLAAIFGAETSLQCKHLRKGSRIGEIDVFVLFADRAVVQCKSREPTLKARKGNDLQLRDDFKKSVQDLYDQAHLCAKSLSNPDIEFIGENGRKVSLPSLREIYPVCVVSDHYPALSVQAREFLKYETGRDNSASAPSRTCF